MMADASVDAERAPAVAPPRAPGDAPALAFLSAAIGVFVFALAGYLLPTQDYSFLDFGWILTAFFLLGLAVVALAGGRTRVLMTTVYGAYAVLACAAMVGATWNASRIGTSSPLWVIDRFAPRDDFNLFEYYIYPYIGARDLSLLEGQSNAPLHWYANVQLQNLMVMATGVPKPWAGMALNVVIGSLTAAFVIGSVERSLPKDGGRGLRGRHFAFLVLSCPWPIAASVIAIREVWVYLAFAVALYVGMVVRRSALPTRVGATFATLLVVGPTVYLLRSEMVGIWMLLLLLAVFETRDVPTGQTTWYVIRFGLLAFFVAGTYTLVSREALESEILRHAVHYSSGAELGVGEQGLVLSIAKQGLFIRGLVETLWLWFQPLPKIPSNPGSLYTLALTITPFWTFACVALVWLGPRSRDAGSVQVSAPVELGGVPVRRRFALHVLWLVGLTASIGFTSCETRHLYVAVPLLCVIVANALDRRYDPSALRLAQLRAFAAVIAAIGACVVFTLLVFGRLEF